MFFRPLLMPIAVLYGLGQKIDRGRKSARRYRSLLPVISVGNISVGGSGKTPLVMHLLRMLGEERPLLILSRGYGRDEEAPVIWRAGDELPDPHTIGDEPALMARVMRRGAIGVAADRAGLLRDIEGEYHDAVVLLDDGFQQYQLARDLDIVIVDDRTAEMPWLLPAGDLREAPSALERADVIVATSDRGEIFARRWMREDAMMVRMRVEAQGVSRWCEPALAYDNQPALLVTGIARPERVLQSLRRLGIEPREQLMFRDHRRYDDRDVARILETMKRTNSRAIITTGKDAVKLEHFPALRDILNVVDLRVDLDNEPALNMRLHNSLTTSNLTP